MDKKIQGSRGRTAQSRRTRVDRNKVELMLALMLRNGFVFEAIREIIKPQLVAGYDRGFALLLTLVGTFHDKYSALPEFEFLLADIEEQLNENPSYLTPPEQRDLDEFLSWVFGDNTVAQDVSSRKHVPYCVEVAKQFASEQLAATMSSVIDSDTVVADLPSVIAEFKNQADLVASVSSEDVSVAFEDDWYRHADLNLFRTGLSFIDEYMGGGQAAGEVYGLLGPYGSCKSTIAYMLAVEGAQTFFTKHRQDPAKPRMFVAIVSYEDSRKDMQHRTIGYAARVGRRTLASLKNKDTDLSRTGHLKDYEKALFADELAAGKRVLGEYERMESAKAWLNDHIVFLDMTGSSTRPGVGSGYISEIARHISFEVRKRGNARCGLIIIDYVGAMVRRHITSPTGDGFDNMRHYVGGAPIIAKNELATPFEAPVWLLHQFTGSVNGRNETFLASHDEAAEAKNFGENLNFSFSIGKPNLEGLAVFGCTKHRRQGPKPNTIIQVDGEMYRVVCANDTYTIDPNQRKIVLASDYRTVHGAAAGRRRAITSIQSPSDLEL